MKLTGIIQFLVGAVIVGALSACSGGSSGGGSSGGGGSTAATLYSLSGTVSGLNTGSDVSLIAYINNSTNSASSTSTVTVSLNGTFSSQPIVPAGGSFVVLVSSQPSGQVCTLSNGALTDVTANVTNLSLVCSATTFTLGGTVNGLLAGQSVTLVYNSQYTANVTQNGAFTFGQSLAQGSDYDVTVQQQSPTSNCTLANNQITGSPGIQQNITNVQVTCSVQDVVIHSFAGPPDGLNPGYALVQAGDNNFYGMTGIGGNNTSVNANGYGTIYEITWPDYTESIVHNFAGSAADDGFCPQGALTLGTDGNLYGTTCHGGLVNTANAGDGTLFKYTLGSGVTLLHSFGSGTDGVAPHGALVQTADGSFYGTTENGGTHGLGAIFKYSNGTVTTVWSFGSTGDGRYPVASLVLGSDGNLYGTTYGGGAHYTVVSNAETVGGTVFQFNPTTQQETVLYSFGASGTDGNMVNTTNQEPAAGLVYSNGYFWGTTPTGGSHNLGTIFKIASTGAGSYQQVYSFAGGSTDGANPQAGLLYVATDGNFYGTTVYGGSANKGTMFRYVPGGSLTVLYSFQGGTTDGENPYAPLILSNDKQHFYGTTMFGGAYGDGTAFKF